MDLQAANRHYDFPGMKAIIVFLATLVSTNQLDLRKYYGLETTTNCQYWGFSITSTEKIYGDPQKSLRTNC